MDKKNIHITFSSEDLAVPEVHVEEDGDESALTDENTSETDSCEISGARSDEKTEPVTGSAQKEDLTRPCEKDETDKDDNKKDQHKIKTHVQYDTLAIPEVSIKLDD